MHTLQIPVIESITLHLPIINQQLNCRCNLQVTAHKFDINISLDLPPLWKIKTLRPKLISRTFFFLGFHDLLPLIILEAMIRFLFTLYLLAL